jgi:hypothetical protein
MSFSQLKKQSSLGNLTSKLVKEVEKMNGNGGGSGADERFWKPEVDKTGNGYAVLRFLPAPDGEDLPWVKVFSHAFQGPGGWYIENSLTTLGQKDPLAEINRGLWNSGTEADKETARKQKRKLSFYANVYVVKDPANPQNEGRVFLYKFGRKIFDKIMDVMQPEFEDESPINPFDFWQGANFKLKITKKDGYWNYDKSEFDRPGPLLEDDDALESIWNKEHSLSAFTSPDNFKTYEELQRRLEAVLNRPVSGVREEVSPVELEAKASRPNFERKPEPVEEEFDYGSQSSMTDSDDDALSYFAKLADS